MPDGVIDLALGVLAAGISAAIGWFARTYLWRRKLRRKRVFLGLPKDGEALLVTNRQASGNDHAVHRYDAYALIELAALIKECGAHTQIVSHDSTSQGFGTRAEFCIGGPVSNRRMAAHLETLLPGVAVNVDLDPSVNPEHGAYAIGGRRYPMDMGKVEYALLARIAGDGDAWPTFLFCGQSAITNQATTRYLARNHEMLARRYGSGSFCLLLKIVNSHAYGPDMTAVVADVTSDAEAHPTAIHD